MSFGRASSKVCSPPQRFVRLILKKISTPPSMLIFLLRASRARMKLMEVKNYLMWYNAAWSYKTLERTHHPVMKGSSLVTAAERYVWGASATLDSHKHTVTEDWEEQLTGRRLCRITGWVRRAGESLGVNTHAQQLMRFTRTCPSHPAHHPTYLLSTTSAYFSLST